MESAATRLSTAFVGAVPLVLVLSLGVVQGGYLPDAWVWATPLVAWAAAVGALLGGYGGALRRGWPWIGFAAALLAWTAASAIWSAHPAQSLLEARRAALYVTVVLALVVLARRGTVRTLVAATHAALSLLLVYGLARYLLEARRAGVGVEGNLLAQPLGYANALGVLAALGLLLGLGVATQTRAAAGRAAAVATLPLLALALWLSQSRGSTLALAAGGAVLLLLAPAPALVRALAVAVPASVPAIALAAAYDVTGDLTVPSRRDDALVAAVAAVCAAAAGALAARTAPPEETRRRPRPRRRLLALGIGAVALAAAGAAYTGASEPRALYWSVAWHREVLAHPVLGTGAGTFGLYWLHYGDVARWQGALDAHSLYVETLGELGPVGLLLVAGLLLVPLRSVARRRLGPYGPAAASAYAAFLVHAGIDWDWEMPAVVVAGLACGAALLLGDDEQPEAPPAAVRAAVVAAALVLGAYGIAGVRSNTVPSATAAERTRAPRSGALSTAWRQSGRYGLP